MRDLLFNVDEQILTRDENCDFSNIIKGSHNYLSCSFNFIGASLKWKEYDAIVEFISKLGSKFYRLDGKTSIIVPDEAASGAYFKIKLYCVKGNDIVFPTNTVIVKQRGD